MFEPKLTSVVRLVVGQEEGREPPKGNPIIPNAFHQTTKPPHTLETNQHMTQTNHQTGWMLKKQIKRRKGILAANRPPVKIRKKIRESVICCVPLEDDSSRLYTDSGSEWVEKTCTVYCLST